MTQKQRMEQGLIYDPTADEIMNEQTGVAQYLKEYNSLGLGDEKRIEELLRLVLAECGENCYLQPPFYANWGGAHIHLGNNVYANFNLTAVDDGHIYIGDCTMIGQTLLLQRQAIRFCRHLGKRHISLILMFILAKMFG